MILDVGEGHKINYEVFGNPEGIKVLFLHGGPGLGFSDSDKAIFDPSKFFVIFIDQRGSGKSIPKGGLKHNTTSDLILDIEKILVHLEVDSLIVFGGSWGATLAVLFAAAYPDRVHRLILRGFFSATKDTADIYLRGRVRASHPAEWHRVSSHVEPKDINRVPEDYFNVIRNKIGDYEKAAREWSRYGFSLSRKQFEQGEVDKILSESLVDVDRIIIELHYALNGFFIPNGFVFDQAKKIEGIPVTIIHGTFDYICPIEDAKKLASCLTNSNLITVNAGHSMAEKEIQDAVAKELDRI